MTRTPAPLAPNEAFKLACELVGGQAAMASALGISASAVSQMALDQRQIPAERCPAIERLTKRKVRCEQLRPDVDWAYLRAASGEKETV